MASRATSLDPKAIDRKDAETLAQPVPPENPAGTDTAALAYRLWQERGCPMGSPEEDWFRAESELKHGAVAAK